MAKVTQAGRNLRQELNDHFRYYYTNERFGERYLSVNRDEDLSILMRWAKRYAKRMEDACNYRWASGEKWEKTNLLLQKSIRSIASGICSQEGKAIRGVTFKGDPRGYTVMLHLVTGKGNTMGGDAEGWGIA